MKIILSSILLIILLIIITNISTTLTYSNNVQLEWVRSFNGAENGIDGGVDIALDDSGNIYVTGLTWGGYLGTRDDYVTIKYNTQGVQQWIHIYNGIYNGYDAAQSITVDDSNNVLVTGISDGDYKTIKYNSSGNIIWIRGYGGIDNPSMDWPYEVITDRQCNVYVTGKSDGSGTLLDYATVKYSPSGDQLWAARYHGIVGGDDIAKAIAIDDSGNVYVTGTSKGIGTQQNDIVTIKYNSSGVEQWIQRYRGLGNGYNLNEGNDIAIDSAGNIYVCGAAAVVMGWSNDFVTIKYNSSGELVWLRSYNGRTPYGGGDYAIALAVDDSANIYVTGESSGDTTYFDYATIKYDSSGNQLWVQRYGNSTIWGDHPRAIALDVSGNVYVTGITYYSNNNGDYATIKYSSSGVQEWVQLYGEVISGGNDQPNSIVVDKMHNVYITGGGFNNLTGIDVITLKYSQLVGLSTQTSEIPEEFKLYQNYPNPFNPSTKIKFDIPSEVKGKMTNVKLIVFDVLGREVATLVNELLKPGSYEVEWDGTNYPSGVYYYRLKAGDFVSTKKFILMK